MSPPTAAKRCILLAVPEDDQFAAIIQSGFTEAGWGTVLLHRAEALLEAIRGQAIALALIDMALPEAQETLHKLKLAPETNWVPVVGVFPRDGDPRRPRELRVRAEVELLEPVAVHHILEVSERTAVRSSAPPSTRKIRMILPSRREDLDRAVDTAGAFFQAGGIEETAHTALLAAIREAIGNAIQHGNKHDPTKNVRVECRQNPAAVTVTVHDEGPGFDAESFLRQATSLGAAEAARKRHGSGGQGGLGMLMLLRCTDRVRYNKAGNLLTLTKLLRQPSTRGTHSAPNVSPQPAEGRRPSGKPESK